MVYLWNSQLLVITSYLMAWLTNATTFIITTGQNNIDPEEYSFGPWKCRCPLGTVRCRPSLLGQLAKTTYKYSHAC